MLEYDKLLNDFYEEDVVIYKLLAAYRIVINRGPILEYLKIDTADIITDALDYLQAVSSLNYAIALPKGYSLKPGPKEAKAFVTNSNESLLLWALLGKSKVKLHLKDFSADDESLMLRKLLAKYNKNPDKYLDQSVIAALYNQTSLFNIEAESTIFASGPDKHKLWSYYKIYTDVLLCGTRKLEIDMSNQASLIFGLLYLLQVDIINPHIAFALLDFNLKLVETNKISGNNSCLALIIDAVWYRLTKIFDGLSSKQSVAEYKLFYRQDCGFDVAYLEKFYILMSLYCYNLLNPVYTTRHEGVQGLVKSQLQNILVNPNIASKIFSLLSDLWEKKVDHFSLIPEAKVTKEIKYSASNIFSIISIYNLFTEYLHRPQALKMFGFLCASLDSYGRDLECASHYHRQLDVKVATKQQELDATKKVLEEEKQLKLDVSLSKDKISEQLGAATDKITKNDETVKQQTLHIKLVEHKLTVAEAKIQAAVYKEKEAHKSLKKDFSLIKDIYKQFKHCDYKSKDTILDILAKVKLNLTLLFPKVMRFSDDDKFNFYRSKYLLLIFRFYNKFFSNIRHGLLNSQSKEYFANIEHSLLNYKKARLLLKQFISDSDNLADSFDASRYLKVFTNYLIDIGNNIELTEQFPAKFTEAQELAKYYISFMSDLAQVVKSDAGFVDVSKVTLTKPKL